MGIAHSKCRGHGHDGNLVARRHAAETSEPAPSPDFEPAIGEVAARRIGDGRLAPINILHDRSEDFRIYDRLTCQHERLLIIGIPAQYCGEIKSSCECVSCRSSVVAAKSTIEDVERLDIVSSPSCVMRVERREQGCGPHYGESGLEVMSAGHRQREEVNAL